MPQNEKLISFVMTGRNDNYCGNFVQRMELAVNLLADSIAELGLLNQVELLIVDWNSEIPLREDLVLSEDATSIVRFLVVPVPLAAQCHTNQQQTFQTALAPNIGIRRSRGEYIFVIQADSIIPQPSLLNLVQLLRGAYKTPYPIDKTLFKVSRKMIPYQVTERAELDVDTLNGYLTDCASYLYQGTNARMTAGLGALGAPRGVWHELRGVDESLGWWGFNDIDLGLRSDQQFYSMEISHFGVVFYDLEQEVSVYQDGQAKLMNPHRYPVCIAPNNEHWGLPDNPDIVVLDARKTDLVREKKREQNAQSVAIFKSQEEWLAAVQADPLYNPNDLQLLSSSYQLLHQVQPVDVAVVGLTSSPLSILSVVGNNAFNISFFANWPEVAADDDDTLLTPYRVGKLLKDRRHRGRCGFYFGEWSEAADRYRAKYSARHGLAFLHLESCEQDQLSTVIEATIRLLADDSILLVVSEQESKLRMFKRALVQMGLSLESTASDRLGYVRMVADAAAVKVH